MTGRVCLKLILDKMDVPETRKTDFGWLNRNLGVRNKEHPDFERAMQIIKSLLWSEKAV